jgi:DNA-binding NtrC family response regulator
MAEPDEGASRTIASARTPDPADAGARMTSGVDPERERIEQALMDSAGNQSRAAEVLGIPRRTLVRKIARFGIPRPRR